MADEQSLRTVVDDPAPPPKPKPKPDDDYMNDDGLDRARASWNPHAAHGFGAFAGRTAGDYAGALAGIAGSLVGNPEAAAAPSALATLFRSMGLGALSGGVRGAVDGVPRPDGSSDSMSGALDGAAKGAGYGALFGLIPAGVAGWSQGRLTAPRATGGARPSPGDIMGAVGSKSGMLKLLLKTLGLGADEAAPAAGSAGRAAAPNDNGPWNPTGRTYEGSRYQSGQTVNGPGPIPGTRGNAARSGIGVQPGAPISSPFTLNNSTTNDSYVSRFGAPEQPPSMIPTSTAAAHPGLTGPGGETGAFTSTSGMGRPVFSKPPAVTDAEQRQAAWRAIEERVKQLDEGGVNPNVTTLTHSPGGQPKVVPVQDRVTIDQLMGYIQRLAEMQKKKP